mmetsp:Transcript_64176/g.128855  ORF Transcript_64176/g.128855 Transcript_64176/m.128855 type:complete len:242 (-) Transcript_64176:127-852(-)
MDGEDGGEHERPAALLPGGGARARGRRRGDGAAPRAPRGARGTPRRPSGRQRGRRGAAAHRAALAPGGRGHELPRALRERERHGAGYGVGSAEGPGPAAGGPRGGAAAPGRAAGTGGRLAGAAAEGGLQGRGPGRRPRQGRGGAGVHAAEPGQDLGQPQCGAPGASEEPPHAHGVLGRGPPAVGPQGRRDLRRSRPQRGSGDHEPQPDAVRALGGKGSFPQPLRSAPRPRGAQEGQEPGGG